MTELAFDRRDNSDRVVYRTEVRLLTFDPTQDSWVTAHNLSESGMFVTSHDLYSTGTEMLVDVPLPVDPPPTKDEQDGANHPVSLAMRGRVVWVEVRQGGEAGGMGIAFLDLTANDRRSLQSVVDRGRPMERVRRAEIKLEGLAGTTQAWVRPCAEGLIVSQQPPHLCSIDGKPRGVASVQPEQVTLIALPSMESDQLPEPVEQAEPLDDIPLEVELPSSFLVSGTIDVEEPEDLVKPLPLDTPVCSSRLESQLQSPTEEGPYTLDEAPEPSQWELQPLTDEALAQQQARPRQARRREVLMWLVALLMCAIALASVVHTGLWQRAAASLGLASQPQPVSQKAQGIAPLATAPIPRVVLHKEPLVIHQVAPLADPEPEPRIAATTNKTVPAPAARVVVPKTVKFTKKPRQPRSEGGIRVTMGSGNPALVIPIKGSIKGAVSYKLSSPDAVVINLPDASPSVPFRSYPLTTLGFRLVWVRPRLGGLHLRVFFKDSMPAHRLQILPDRVRLELLDQPESK